MPAWFEHFHLSADPFNEDSNAWNFFYGGPYGIASLKLEQALERKRGIIVVTGLPASGKSTLVRNSLGRMRVCASATVSAAQTNPSAVIDLLLRSREPADGGFSATRKRAALISMIEQARSSNRPIVCVIEDAHLARAGQIKDLIHAIDTAPDAARVFQVVLVGRTPLLDTMRARAVGDLRARTTVTIETARLSPTEISEFLNERLEATEATLPDVILPTLTISAIAHHSHGLIGLAAALARSALERAAETGADTVSVELVEEVASLYGALGERVSRPKHRTARAFALGAMAALVTLALVVAATEVHLLGSGDRRIEANLDALRALAGFGRQGGDATAVAGSAENAQETTIAEAGAGIDLAQLGSPRDEFLRGSGAAGLTYGSPTKPKDKPAPTPAPTLRADSKSGASAPKTYEIKPPTRPGTASAQASNATAENENVKTAENATDTTTITVPGVPGPLRPSDNKGRKVIRSSDYAAPLTPPGAEASAPVPAEERVGPELPGHVPLPDEGASEPAAVPVVAVPALSKPEVPKPKASAPLSPPATDTATARVTPQPEDESGARISLQVGAFRERSSADSLRDKLAQQFKDVYVSTIHSGGEPLYRVRVGKFKAPEDTLTIKDRLQAAGYASFRVSEP